MLNNKLRLSDELPCCKICGYKNTCTKKFFSDAFMCQKDHDDLMSFYFNRKPISRSRVLELLNTYDTVTQTQQFGDLRKKTTGR